MEPCEAQWYATAELSDTEPESWLFLVSGLGPLQAFIFFF